MLAHTRGARGALPCMALFLAAVAPGAGAQAFFVEDVEICPAAAQIRDPEFNMRDKTVAFTDASQRLKVAPVLADTTLGAKGCAGRVIDTNITISLPGITFRNGAEWARSQTGPELFYAKLGPLGQPQLARAWPNGSGGWSTQLLENGDYRQFPVGSINDTDTQSRIFYWRLNPDNSTTTLWRESNAPATEREFPGFVGLNTGGAPRWVPGLRAISTTVPDAQGFLQAAIYNIDSGTLQVLTSDPVSKDEVWLWQAPEFGNAWTMVTVVNGCCVRVYRQTGSTWSQVHGFAASDLSATARAIFSPEPVVYRGRSYLAFQLASSLRYGPSSIWIAAIDPAAPLYRQVSDPATPTQVRNEPEWYVDRNGAWVFYTQVNQVGYALRRTKTGL